MSDGYTDAMRRFEGMADDYLENCVRYHEAKPEDRSPIVSELQRLGSEMADWEPSLMEEMFRLEDDRKLLGHLAAQLKAGSILPLETVFLLLFISHETMKLIRLQKATKYARSLLIFTDKQRRAEPFGVLYATDAKFVDGDQDVILGLAKKRAGATGKAKGRMLVSAHWNYSRKRWQLSDVYVI